MKRVLLATVLAASAVGCGVTFDAPDIAVVLLPGEVVYAEADGEQKLVGGETVLEVRNSTEQERRAVLARVADGSSQIPAELLDAESARDNDDILGFSRVLEAEEVDYGAGGFGKDTDAVSFHVYLRPGDTYVVFDTLTDAADGVVLWLRPGEQGQR